MYFKEFWDFKEEGLKKRKFIYYGNAIWPKYKLNNEKTWSINGRFDFNTVLQLDLFCKRRGKWSAVLYA
jgi:hypothetical protein